MRVRIALVILAAALVVALVGGYALARTTIDAPMETPVRHDDFVFHLLSSRRGPSRGALTDVSVQLQVDNDAKVVGYDWQPSTAYLLDGSGRRCDADPQASSSRRRIAPGDRANVVTVYRVPSQARDLRLAFWDTVMMGDVFDAVKYARVRVRLSD